MLTSFSLLRDAAWGRRGLLRDALLATVLINLLALAISLFAMQVFDRVIPQAGFDTLIVLTAGALLAIALEWLLRHVRGNLLDRESTVLDAELSRWFFDRALAIRMEARPRILGTFAAQIKGLELVRSVVSSGPLFVLADVPFALFFVWVIWLIGGPLAVVPLLTLPIALLAGFAFYGIIRRATAASQGHANRKSGALIEAIDGVESVKASRAEHTLSQRWGHLVGEAGREEDEVKYWSALSGNISQSVQQLSYVALIAYGAYLASTGVITMGALIACSIIGSRALAPFARLPQVLVQWAQAHSALTSLDTLVQLPSEQDERAQQLSPGVLEPQLRFESVRFAYPGNARAALDLSQQAEIVIPPGQRVGVIGAIGSGKSTLLKVACGLWRPGAGRAFLGGVDMAMIAPERLRELVAFVPQEARLIHGTLRDNLILGLDDPGDAALLEAAQTTGLIDLIHSHSQGLALPISEGGRGISGGQRQLVLLTRLLLLKPAVLVLDEPTASMDGAAEARVIALFQRLAEQGTTIVVATHKVAVMAAVERLMVFKDGRLALDGPRDAVLAHLQGRIGPAEPTTQPRTESEAQA